MQGAGGIEHGLAGIELDRRLAFRALDEQLPALVILRRVQEQGEGEIGAVPAHDRVVDMKAVFHARLVARDQDSEDRFRLGVGGEEVVALQRLAHLAPDRVEPGPAGELLVRLHPLRGPARRRLAVLIRLVLRDELADLAELIGVEDGVEQDCHGLSPVRMIVIVMQA